MTKRFLSVLLSFVLVLSTMTTVFAASDTPKEEFSSRLETTLARLAAENKTASRYGDTNPLIKRLTGGAYEYVIAMDFDMPGDAGSFSLNNTYNGLPSANKYLDMMKVAISADGVGSQKFDLNIYGDSDKLSLNVPSVSDKFYYVNKSDYRKWDNSEYAENLGIDSEVFKAIDGYFSMLLFTDSKIMDYQLPEGLADPYVSLFKDCLQKATYRTDGSRIVQSSRGSLATDKYTVTIRGTAMEKLQSDLVALIRRDNNVRDYLGNIYGSMPSMTGSGDMADMVIESFCQMIEEIDLGDYLRYSIYVSNNGYIISHEFTCGEDNADEYYFLKIDTTGKNYLMDELKFSAGVVDKSTDEAMSVDFAISGSLVAPTSAYNCKFSANMNTFGETSNLFSGSLYYDATKSADNFNMTFSFDEDGMLGTAGKIVIPGDVEIDNARNIINMDFSDIKLTFGEESGTMNMLIRFAPIDASVVDVPTSSQVNVFDLTEEDVTDLTKKLNETFSGL